MSIVQAAVVFSLVEAALSRSKLYVRIAVLGQCVLCSQKSSTVLMITSFIRERSTYTNQDALALEIDILNGELVGERHCDLCIVSAVESVNSLGVKHDEARSSAHRPVFGLCLSSDVARLSQKISLGSELRRRQSFVGGVIVGCRWWGRPDGSSC